MASFFSNSSLIICWMRVVLRLAYLAIAPRICSVRVCMGRVFSNNTTYLFGESMLYGHKHSEETSGIIIAQK